MHGFGGTRRSACQSVLQANADAAEISPAARNIACFIVPHLAVEHRSASGGCTANASGMHMPCARSGGMFHEPLKAGTGLRVVGRLYACAGVLACKVFE